MIELRRKDRAINTSETMALLQSAEYGILSTIGQDGQPYGVPLSYVYKNNAIYIHCALSGHKIDNISNNPRVSFCVVGRTKVLPAEFSTEYESVIAFGNATEVRGTEWESALMWLVEKYAPDFVEEGRAKIEQLRKVTNVIKITIDHMSGKKRR